MSLSKTLKFLTLPPLSRPVHMEAYFVRAPDICTMVSFLQGPGTVFPP